MPGSGVTVLGSLNMDLGLSIDAFVAAGQTVLAAERVDGPGGKGLNQAVAAARAGAVTRVVAATGDDHEGAELRRILVEEGIDPLIRTTRARTGLAVVMVDATGENAIVVSPGANAELVELTSRELAAVAAADVLLLQLEVPLPTVEMAARAARDAGTTVVLNAAPAMAGHRLPLDSVDVLLVNEGEARAVAGRHVADDELTDELLDGLLEMVPAIVVTLGADGVDYRDRDGTRRRVPGRPVKVVDTTAAGDTFAGYLVAALADGGDIESALLRANTAASLCVQRRGATTSVPRRHEVDQLLRP